MLWAASGRAQRFRQPPQDIPGQLTCSLCGQERVWPTKVRCFRCGNPRNNDPIAPGPIVGPTGRAPQRTPATNPTFRRDGRQNKISGQHVPSVVLPQQPPAESVGAMFRGLQVRVLTWYESYSKIFCPVKTMPRKVHSWNHQNLKSLRSIKIWLTNSRSMVRS